MQTVILAAGEGTRMQPLTARRPKPMLPVGDGQLVAHTADAAVEADASRLVFVVSYEADAVREWFGTEYTGVPVEYAVQRHQRGTADAVRAAKEQFDDESFAVLNGTTCTIPGRSRGCTTRRRPSAPTKSTIPGRSASWTSRTAS